MKALRLVLITSMCTILAFAAKAQVKVGENELETSEHHWLEIDKTDSLFIITDDLFLGITNNPHRLGTSPAPATDAIMLKLYGYGLNQFIPSLISPQVQQTYFLGPVKTNVFAGIASDGSLMEVPLSLTIEVTDSTQADLSFFNGIDTFGTTDLLVLDTVFATDNQLRDTSIVLRSLITTSRSADGDTLTQNEYINEIDLIGDSLAFRENIANEQGTVNEIGVSLRPLIEDNTFYLSDGTLDEDRVVDGGTHSLSFSNLDSFEVNTNDFVVVNGQQIVIQQDGQDIIQINANEDVKIRSTTTDSILLISESGNLLLSTYGDSSNTGTVSTILAVDAQGNLIEIGAANILATDIDSTIYTHDGTLTDERIMTMGQPSTPHNLFFVSPDGADTTVIDESGRIGIGVSQLRSNSATSDVKLEVNGDILAIKVHSSSDRRFKKNISTIESALQKVMSIEGVTYDFKTAEFANRNFPTGKQVGFIAQNVESVLPEVVITNGDGYKAVDYAKMTALLNEAIKEQQAQIDILTKKLDDSEQHNSFLTSEIAEIKQLLKTINHIAED